MAVVTADGVKNIAVDDIPEREHQDRVLGANMVRRKTAREARATMGDAARFDSEITKVVEGTLGEQSDVVEACVAELAKRLLTSTFMLVGKTGKGSAEEAQKLYGRPSVSDEEAQELGSSPPLVFGTLPDGLTEHMYFFLVRAWRVHGREAAAYVKRCNAELEMGFTEEDDGYVAFMMPLYELPRERVTKEHMMLFRKCKADEDAQLQVVSAAVDLTAALDQLDETE